MVLGRLLDLSESTATLATAGGQPVTVRVSRRPGCPCAGRAGDGVLVVGQPEADGSWVARAVLLRRAGR